MFNHESRFRHENYLIMKIITTAYKFHQVKQIGCLLEVLTIKGTGALPVMWFLQFIKLPMKGRAIHTIGSEKHIQ